MRSVLNLPGAVCYCSALLDSCSSCEWRPRGHGLRTVIGLYGDPDLGDWLCFARGAGKNPAWLKCMTAQRCVSLLKAGGRVPLAFPLRCYAWIVGSLVRFLCVGYCLAEVVLLVPVLLGQCAPAFIAGLGAAGGGAVTYCCRSLSCDGHSFILCGCPLLSRCAQFRFG